MNTIEHIDPAALVVETNVRTLADPDPGFVDSIRAHGVLTPILGWRDGDVVHVRAGQRRTLAARAAGLATVPVYVVDAADLDSTDTARRIVEQLVENDQRAALTDADRVQAWRALELEGLGAAANRRGRGRTHQRTVRARAGTGTRQHPRRHPARG